MKTFDLDLIADEWQEILKGKGFVAFDLIAAATAQILFTETMATPAPSTGGNDVHTWSEDWDFSATNVVVGVQRIWVKGTGPLRGVR